MLVGPSGASRAGLSQGEPWGHRAMGMQSHRQVGHKAPETWHGGAEAHRGWAPPTQHTVPRSPAEAEALPILVAS